MPEIDCSVYITFQNNTNETLVDGHTDEEANRDLGKWIGFPSHIFPHSAASFKLVETAWFTGTSGTFRYTFRDADRHRIEVFQCDAYTGTNKIACSATPAAVYALSFNARVADGEYLQDSVASSGHPIYVRYSLDYERKRRYQFQLVEITAISAHPVRNSRRELIAGQHTLWRSSSPSAYLDKNSGSFAPNIFKYEFGSRVAASGILDVKVRPIEKELLGAEVMLYGTRDGIRVMESDYFVFPDHITDVIVQAHVIDPATSATPFVFNAEVDWGMELWVTKYALQRAGPGVTRLELYWIAMSLHRAFKPYVPVIFLRNVLVPIEKMTVQATDIEFYQYMTKRVFNDYNKLYNTVTGRSAFGPFADGGNFNQALYLLSGLRKNPTGQQPGLLFRYVNCMDQAAMLELSCSLGGFPSTTWLYQSPFGYINNTHLVGVKDAAGALINVNNPLFGTDKNHAELDIEDDRRGFFGLHVYIGHSFPKTDDGMRVYDACSGPHLGTETIGQYITNVIDDQTKLYKTNPRAGPGKDVDVYPGQGVATIDGQQPFSQTRTRRTMPLPEPLSRLVNTVVANAAGPVAHTGWAHLPIWLDATLGDAWDIQYEQVSVSETGTQALWLISNANIPNSPIHIHINVASMSTQDGHFDIEQSAAIVKEDIEDILMSTERQDIWISSTLPGIEGVSLQYADHVAAGRIVLIAGNVVMDIAGMTSYEELLPYALKLLNRTVCHLCRSPPIIPVIQSIRMGTTDVTSGTAIVEEPQTATGIITVTGIHTHFSLIFAISCQIAAVNAGSEGHGVLFDRHIIEELDNEAGCTVEFLFIAWEAGRHRVRICVADSETMIGAKLDLDVEVVGT